MHDAAASTIAEYIGLIHDYGKGQGTFSLSLVFDEAGDYSSAFIFGSEAPDSPMAGGASYGYGKTLVEALKGIVDECRLIEKRDAQIRTAASDPTRLAAIAACPEPFWHKTHRYCPTCPWTEADEPQVAEAPTS